MSGNSAPAAPDYSGVISAQQNQYALYNKLMQEQLAWAKQTYAQYRPQIDKIINGFIQSQDQSNKWAAADRARYEQEFQPLEDQLIHDADTYNNPAFRKQQMGAAEASVAQSYDQARKNAAQNLEAYGINPSATRYAALDVGLRANQAADQAAAGNQAGLQTDAIGRELRGQAINIGRGYPAQATGELGTGLSAGSAGVSGYNSSAATGSSMMTAPTAWGNLSQNALSGWGNLLNQQYQNQLAEYNANQQSSSGIGAILGLAGSAFMGPTKPWIFAAKGGAIPTPDEGGAIPASASPSRGAITDDVPAATQDGSPIRLNAGEFVIPKDVVRAMGTTQLHKLIIKARQDSQKIPQESGAIPDVRPMPQRVPAQHPAVARRQALPMAA